MLDVKAVVARFALNSSRVVGIAAADLRKPGNAGPHDKAFVVAGNIGEVCGGVLECVRSRADKAHFARENVQDVWQLVELGATKQPSEPRDTVFIKWRVGCPQIGMAACHRAELPYSERSSILSHPDLAKEDRPWVHKRIGQIQNDREDHQHRQGQDGKDQVDCALGEEKPFAMIVYGRGTRLIPPSLEWERDAVSSRITLQNKIPPELI